MSEATAESITCEVQLLSWSDTSAKGPVIVLQLADAAELEAFKLITMAKGRGKTAIAGQRLMAVFVEIGDDELPVQTKNPAGPLCRLAGVWCADPIFAQWLDLNHLTTCRVVEEELGAASATVEGVAAEVVRRICGVKSRRDLDTNEQAGAVFHAAIREPYSKFLRGRE